MPDQLSPRDLPKLLHAHSSRRRYVDDHEIIVAAGNSFIYQH